MCYNDIQKRTNNNKQATPIKFIVTPTVTQAMTIATTIKQEQHKQHYNK